MPPSTSLSWHITTSQAPESARGEVKENKTHYAVEQGERIMEARVSLEIRKPKDTIRRLIIAAARAAR